MYTVTTRPMTVVEHQQAEELGAFTPLLRESPYEAYRHFLNIILAVAMGISIYLIIHHLFPSLGEQLWVDQDTLEIMSSAIGCVIVLVALTSMQFNRSLTQGNAANTARSGATVEEWHYTANGVIAVEVETENEAPPPVTDLTYDPEECYLYFFDIGNGRLLFLTDFINGLDVERPFPCRQFTLICVSGTGQVLTVVNEGEALVPLRTRSPLTSDEYHPDEEGGMLPGTLATLDTDLRRWANERKRPTLK